MRLTLNHVASMCGALLISAGVAQAAEILAAPNGMTLYVFSKDENSVSACYDDCAKKWPPFVGKADEKMPEGWTLQERTDGTMQWLYEGKPTYFFVDDKKTGDMMGDGVGGVWSVIRE